MPEEQIFEADDIFSDFLEMWQFQDKDTGFEINWKWPLENGFGSMHMIKLRTMPAKWQPLNDG